jgi:MFS family permease
MVPRPGSAAAAFAHRDFRRMWIGSFGSNIGTWMQNVVMGSYVYKLTERTGHPSTYTGLIIFAQLGPLIVFAMIGGVLADRLDRRKWLIALQSEQALFSFVLAAIVAASKRPSFGLLFATMTAIGIGNAFNAPTWSSIFPSLVGKQDLPGALALNSTLINGTRVIGPAIGGILYPILGAAWIFSINAITYLFIIAALLIVRLPKNQPTDDKTPLIEQFLAGVREARSNPIVGRCLVTIFTFSLLSLPFLGLFPSIAEKSLHLNSKSAAYGWLYASFGLGAMLGSLSVGTVFTNVSRRRIVRRGLAGFAVMAFIFGLLRAAAPAYPVVFVLGAFYFGTTTALLTVMQRELDDGVRARVMALWFIGFGGTVAIAGLIFGPILDATNSTVLLTIGAVVAFGLALWWWPKFIERFSTNDHDVDVHAAHVSDP